MIKNRPVEVYNTLFRHAEWNIGIVHAPISVFLKSDSIPEICWLPRYSSGKFLADPFAVTRDGRTYVFCEEFDYLTRKGRIVAFELADTRCIEPSVAIELPIHMSYPYLVQHGGQVYCVPETHLAREISLYEPEEFPYQWKKASRLISNFNGVDATVFRHEDRWWLTCISPPGEGRLFVWHAPELFGPWTPHEANPVKTDISSSRPAGTPFVHDGNLYRPAQDCTRTPGGRIIINRLVNLTPTEFAEEPIRVIEPNLRGPYPSGLHTISAAGSITIVDGKRITFNKSAFTSALMRRSERFH
jgi:hypothetical protein